MKSMLIVVILLFLGLQSCNQSNTNAHNMHQKHAMSAGGTKESPHKVSMKNIGNAHVHIEYNAPSVRERVIWGELVPYGKVWVTGAHEATFIQFYEDVKVNGTPVKKGKYGLFTIPQKDTWTIIINKNWNQHLTDDYTQEEDVLRFEVTPEQIKHKERLTYRVIVSDETSGKVEILWEKLKVSFDITAEPMP